MAKINDEPYWARNIQRHLEHLNAWNDGWKRLLNSNNAWVMTAVKQDGRALEYASAELKGDREIVMEAAKQNGHAPGTHRSSKPKISPNIYSVPQSGKKSPMYSFSFSLQSAKGSSSFFPSDGASMLPVFFSNLYFLYAPDQ